MKKKFEKKEFSAFKTTNGTELPILNLKGKPYLQVAHRLVWFREENPNGIIKTEMIDRGGEGMNEYAVFRSEIYIQTSENLQPMLVATGHKKETKKDFADFMEKCETGAIGRALAMAGYGTQFTGDELDEGDRLADAPITPATHSKEEISTEVDAEISSEPEEEVREEQVVEEKVDKIEEPPKKTFPRKKKGFNRRK